MSGQEMSFPHQGVRSAFPDPAGRKRIARPVVTKTRPTSFGSIYLLALLAESEHDARRETNRIREVAIRAEAEVLHLLSQRESPATQRDICAPASSKYKTVVRIAHSTDENLREGSESAPTAVGKPRAKRVCPCGQPRRDGSGVIQSKITDRSQPVVDIESDGAAAAIRRDVRAFKCFDPRVSDSDVCHRGALRVRH
jgi:hypothetical protein